MLALLEGRAKLLKLGVVPTHRGVEQVSGDGVRLAASVAREGGDALLELGR